MRDSSMPSPAVDVTGAALSPELLAPRQARGSDVPLPTGYDAHVISGPPADARAVLELADALDELGDARVRHAAGALSDVDAQTVLATVSGRLGRAVRLLTGAAAVVAVAAVVLVASPAPRAAAMEAPHPDPVPVVAVSVTLSSLMVRVAVPVTTSSATRAGYHCASVWGPTSYGRGFVGRACSRSARFVVPVTLVSRFVPLGRSTMAVTDDVDPLGTLPQAVALTARRPSRFGVGTWLPMPQGQIYVSAPLYAWTPSVGAWTAQQASPVQVQELVGRTWRVRATLTTTSTGVATGWVYLGGGRHVVRVARVQGANVTAATGTARTFDVATEVPIDAV